MELDKLKKICKDKNIPISKLERDLGFPRSSIYKWKSTEPSIQKVKKVAQYLDLKVDDLL